MLHVSICDFSAFSFQVESMLKYLNTERIHQDKKEDLYYIVFLKDLHMHIDIIEMGVLVQ